MFLIPPLLLLTIATSSTARAEETKEADPLLDSIFPHFSFSCDPTGETYETEFQFLQGLGHGFVHAEPHRIFFEYYFPAQHWVGFSTADQSIQGTKDECSQCYYTQYYPQTRNGNNSNLYPLCIEECLDDVIFVATVNSDEQNINNWNIIEFQITAQKSKAFDKKMYRIPKSEEVLEIWGSEYYTYRENAHFEIEMVTITVGPSNKEFIHGKFWRKYDFAPDSDFDEYDTNNEWKPFVRSSDNGNLTYADSLCFLSVASFYGGEYPYDDDALEGMLPGFYIDSQHLANMHCFKRSDIKVDCGQDWSFLSQTGTSESTETPQSDILYESTVLETAENIDTNDIETLVDNSDNYDADIIVTTKSSTTSSTSSTTKSTTQKKATKSTLSSTKSTARAKESSTTTNVDTLQPFHGEDCCSAVSLLSYDDISCDKVANDNNFIKHLEKVWKNEQCGREDKLPTALSDAVNEKPDQTSFDEKDCNHLWAFFTQIHEICYKYPHIIKAMKVFNYFKKRGAFECFNRNTKECEKKETKVYEFNNFDYDSDTKSDNTVDFNDLLLESETSVLNATEIRKMESAESELASMEEDGGLTMTSLAILALIISLLALYILYWFCCSASSKGYRQSSQFVSGGYYEDDIDTDDYQRKSQYYNERVNGGYALSNGGNDGSGNSDSDWSEDEQLGVANDNDKGRMKKSKKNKSKKSKKKKKKSENYDLNRNDLDSMPMGSDNPSMNDAIEVTVQVSNDNENEIGNDAYEEQYYDEQNETVQQYEEEQSYGDQ